MAITRERVLQALDRSGRPWLTPRMLLRAIEGRADERRLVTARLRELLREGRVERLRGRYRLRGEPPRERSSSGKRSAQRAGGERSSRGKRSAQRAGDARNSRGRHARAVAEPRDEFVGILAVTPRGGRVTPYRDDHEWEIRVPRRELAGARDGDVVVVRPVGNRQARSRTGRVVERLGPPGDPEADFRAVAWRRRIRLRFPAEALAEAEALPSTPEAAELARRVDLRALPFVTIDPATARDHDDAVCIKAGSGGGTRLWVAIADVSHYVAEGGALDAEAFRRGNSVYFPDRAVPMLPERLSASLCSLHAGVDRLVLTAELELGADGEVLRRSFYPAVIRSRASLSYDDAARVMENPEAGIELDPSLREPLAELAELARVLVRRRFAAGSIDFDLPSAEIVLGDDGHPVDIIEAPRTLAHRAIEEAMLAANRAVAECLEEARVPALYRVHEPPVLEDMAALRELLETFGLIESSPRAALAPHEIARAIQRVAGRPEERLVNLVALRSMRQARYEAANRGHFALAFSSYTHFTSPIRRYADLVVHRALKDLLAATPDARRRAEVRGARLARVAERISASERAAMEAEREAVDLKKCAFMRGHVGECFDGTVTGVARQGLYVTLDPFFVEGLVHVATLPEYVVLDERGLALVARRSGRRYTLGERVRVLVERVDPVRGWINFSLIDSGAARRDARGRPRASKRRRASGTRGRRRSRARADRR